MEARVSVASLTPELLELICSYLGELDIARTIAVAVHSTLAAAALEQAGVHSTTVIQEHSLSWAARLPLAQHVVGLRELRISDSQRHFLLDHPGPALRTLGLASLIQLLQDETHWFADEEARYQAAAAWLRTFRWWPRPAGEAAAAIGAVRLARMPPCAQQRVLDDAAEWPEARAALLAQSSTPATGAWSFGFAVPLPSSAAAFEPFAAIAAGAEPFATEPFAAAAEAAAAEVEDEDDEDDEDDGEDEDEDEEDEDEDDGGVPPFRWGSVPFWVAGAYLHAEAGAYVVYGMHGAVNEVPEMEVGISLSLSLSLNPKPKPNPNPNPHSNPNPNPTPNPIPNS